VTTPFEGLTPAPDDSEVRWATARMEGKSGVALVVPSGFEAAARVMHGLGNGRTWETEAPAYLGRGGRYPYPFPFEDGHEPPEGNLPERDVDTLVPLLRDATASPERCHYGMWIGWGWTSPGSHATMVAVSGKGPLAQLRARWARRRAQHEDDRAYAGVYAFVAGCPVVPWWGARDTLLFDGPIEAVVAIGQPWPGEFGPIARQSPQWWWPHDRAWFVGTEIDYPWTYVVGSEVLIAAIQAIDSIESVRVDVTDKW
jgi:hypothetical protein